MTQASDSVVNAPVPLTTLDQVPKAVDAERSAPLYEAMVVPERVQP
jgi:hypothetical protein